MGEFRDLRFMKKLSLLLLLILLVVTGCTREEELVPEMRLVLSDSKELSLYMTRTEVEAQLRDGQSLGSEDYWEYPDFYIGYADDIVTSIEAKTSGIKLQSGLKIGSLFAEDNKGTELATEYPGTVIHRYYYTMVENGMLPVAEKKLPASDEVAADEKYCLLDLYVDKSSDIILFIALQDITRAPAEYLPGGLFD